MDRFTRWCDAIPLQQSDALSVTKALLRHWISRFGVPTTITTDRGQQFESRLLKSLFQLLGTSRIRTTAYHPAANGMVERFHRQLKDSLRATENVSTWFDALPLILLHLRTTLKPILGCSPAQLVYGTTLRIPGEFLHTSPTVTSAPVYVQELQLLMQALQPPSVDHHLSTASSTGYVPSALQQASHVFVRHDAVRKPLQPPYDGPYAVLERTTTSFHSEHQQPTSSYQHPTVEASDCRRVTVSFIFCLTFQCLSFSSSFHSTISFDAFSVFFLFFFHREFFPPC